MKRNVWRKPSSCPNNATCVEVMETRDEILVRDSKGGGDGRVLHFTHEEWAAFLDGVDNGEFDPEAEE
jgi:hypothetical protein